MAWYYGTYTCGHEGEANVIGPKKNRQWKVDNHFNGLCPECYKKERQMEREKAEKEAVEKSAEMELPALTGTEKQVAWANTIRIDLIESFMKMIENNKNIFMYCNSNDERIPNVTKEELVDLIDYISKEYTSAKFWIESRTSFNFTAGDILLKLRSEESKKLPDDVAEDLEKYKEVLTVTPTDQKKKGVVVLDCNPAGTIITAKYVKDEDFRRIIKGKKFKWNPEETKWEKEITEYTGSILDRIADVGNTLIKSGFTVQFPNVESKDKAISAKFVVENDRWVKYNTISNKLAICWDKRSDTLYETAKRLPGARWSNGSMLVGVEFYREVLDFSETMGFSVSKKSRQIIEAYRKKEAGFETADVEVKQTEYITDEERIKKSLINNGTILEDLLDET